MNDTCKNDNNKCNLSCKEKIDKLIKPLFILIAIYFLSKFFTDDLSRKEMINYGAGIAFISIMLIISYIEKIKFTFKFNFRAIYGWLIFMPLFLSKQCSIEEHNIYVMITGFILTILILDIANYIIKKYFVEK
jgi:hypothetical protein